MQRTNKGGSETRPFDVYCSVKHEDAFSWWVWRLTARCCLWHHHFGGWRRRVAKADVDDTADVASAVLVTGDNQAKRIAIERRAFFLVGEEDGLRAEIGVNVA